MAPEPRDASRPPRDPALDRILAKSQIKRGDPRPRSQVAGEESLAVEETIVQVVGGVGINVDTEGAFVRVKVETLTQGEIVLHVEPKMVTELINMLMAGRVAAERLAAKAGKPVLRAITPVQSYAVGDVPQMPAGVMLILNHDTPGESVFVLPSADGARDIAKALATEANAAGMRSRGLIPPLARKAGLLGPGGRPIAAGNGSKQ